MVLSVLRLSVVFEFPASSATYLSGIYRGTTVASGRITVFPAALQCVVSEHAIDAVNKVKYVV